MAWSLTAASLTAVGLVLSLAFADASGVPLLFRGEGTAIGTAHAMALLPVLALLLAHLATAGARRVTLGVAAGFAALGIIAAVSRSAAPARAPESPPFAYATRDSALYDSADWCGECHESIYQEWHRSVHARTLGIPDFRAKPSRKAVC